MKRNKKVIITSFWNIVFLWGLGVALGYIVGDCHPAWSKGVTCEHRD